MLYHPPYPLSWFVGLTLPFAHGFASLLTKDTSNFWVKDVRSWTIISWVFLTVGIVLGGQWAYVELGWGGYWAWDPVENASLLPWITATGYLHSALIYEKRGRLKLWTYMLAWISFELCIFGTFLTRSGVIDSVHSFGKSSLGVFFIVFMLISSVIYFYYLAKNKQNLTKESEIHLLSREVFLYCKLDFLWAYACDPFWDYTSHTYTIYESETYCWDTLLQCSLYTIFYGNASIKWHCPPYALC